MLDFFLVGIGIYAIHVPEYITFFFGGGGHLCWSEKLEIIITNG